MSVQTRSHSLRADHEEGRGRWPARPLPDYNEAATQGLPAFGASWRSCIPSRLRNVLLYSGLNA